MPIASVLHILRTIKDRGPVSRTDLQHLTGLSWGTITNTTRELLGRKFIREQGALSTKAGRKPVQLALNTAAHTLLGVEIAAGRIGAILIHLGGEILWQETATFATEQPAEAVLGIAAHLVRRGQHAAGGRTALGVGLVVPGPIDAARGTLLESTKLPGWKGLAVREMLEARVHLPVHLEQHANALALAHRWFGQSQGGAEVEHFICVHLGETVELGIISGGDIFRGHAGMAGNFAHLTLEPGGPACGCGSQGCVEVFCSSQAVASAAVQSGSNGAVPTSVEQLAALAASGDDKALAAFDRLGKYLGMGIAALAQLFDPALFVLVGKTTAGARFFQPALERHLQARQVNTRIVISPLNDHAPALGVCALIVQNAFLPESGSSAPAASPEALPA